MTTVTVLSGPERRRRWPASEKARIVAESLLPGAVVGDVARRHDVHENLLHGWRRQARMSGPPVAADTGDRLVPVRISAGAKSSSALASIEILLSNGVVLRVSEGAEVGRAAQLAAALAGLSR